MIYDSIVESFNRLDEVAQSCDKLKEAKKTYYQALNEEHLGIDHVKNNQEQYQEKTKEKKSEVASIQKEIGEYFCNGYKTLEPLTVGLFSEWGSGKTHLLQGVKYKIKEQQNIKLWENTPKESETINKLIIPIFFNAWRFEKEEHIIIPLFQTMLSELEGYDHIPKLKLLKQKLTILSVALVSNLQLPKGFDVAKVLSGDFSALKNMASFFNFSGATKTYKEKSDENNPQKQLEALLQSGDLNSIYLKIPEWIEKITIYDDVRFVFLIDDLDRCLPENTLKMLESIKLFLDVAGCSFVLAVDDDVVERGVEHHYRDYIQRNNNHTYINCNEPKEHKSQEKEQEKTETKNYQNYEEKKAILPITGNEYLEKMVQLPFRIPPIDDTDIKEFLQNRYDRFKEQEQEKKENIHE